MNYQNLKCSELKDLLAKRGLPSHGKKNELLERLLKHEEEEKAKAANKEQENIKSKTITDGKNKKNPEKSTEHTLKKIEKENKTGNQSHTVELSEHSKTEGALFSHKEILDKAKMNVVMATDMTHKSVTFYEQNAAQQVRKTNNSVLQNKEENKVARSDKNEVKEKTTIPKITYSETSLPSPNKIEKNIVTIGGNNNLTEQEKRELRKKRFGIVSKDEILESRAKRFSIVTKKMEDENKRKRAERFGLNVPSLNDPETKRRRAERFGLCPEVIMPSKMEERRVRFHLS